MKDYVTFQELMIWREALSTCAIENNEYAIKQLKLWDTDRVSFLKEYLKQQLVGEK